MFPRRSTFNRLAVGLALALVVGIVPTVRAAEPLSATIHQVAVSLDTATNKETVTVTGEVVGFVAPYRYAFAVRGATVASGVESLPTIAVDLLDNCSTTTQSVTFTVTDALGLTVTAGTTLDHSLCPAPPAVNHAGDLVMAGPTIMSTSFVDRLRAVGSPAFASGDAIYAALLVDGVNPSFALGVFQAESGSGTQGYAVTTLNWGNMLYRSWQAAYGAVPYAPGNGYTYARFPTWLASVRAYGHLLDLYDQSGYVTVSEASAHWLGAVEGSTRHLNYLRNITSVMSALPDDAVPHMTSLVAPIAALPTFTVSWAATDNVAVTGYQVRTKQGTGAWSAPEDRTARIETFTLANGTWVFGVRATDAAGNWSAWREVTVVVDGSAPVMTSLTAPSLVKAKDGSFVATFVASDNVAVSGYAIRTRKGAAEAWSATTWQSTRTKAFGKLAAGTWYLSVSARDSAGNMSAWREIRVVVPRDDRSYRFSRGTVRLRGASEFMRTQTTTSVRGATMTVRFTGDAFYLIGTTAMSRGQMRVTIDGTAYKIDEGRYHGSRSISTHHRVLLLSKALANKAHVVVITNLATSRRPTISIDGLGWRN